MYFFEKTVKVVLDSSASTTVIDDLHACPFHNLTIWLRPLSDVTFTYAINYGNKVQNSGSSSGALKTYNDPQIFPANQPNANWSRKSNSIPYVVGTPISVDFTNTSGETAAFLCSIMSETYSTMI